MGNNSMTPAQMTCEYGMAMCKQVPGGVHSATFILQSDFEEHHIKKGSKVSPLI